LISRANYLSVSWRNAGEKNSSNSQNPQKFKSDFERAEMSRIRSWLYLGSSDDAANLESLQKHNVTHILNVADDVPNHHPELFVYKNLHVKDFGADEGICRVFPEAFEFAEIVKNEENAVLFVHCLAGINRSSTVVTAILMKVEGLTLKEAFEAVANARPWVSPLEDNRRQLLKFEEEKAGKNTMEEIDFVYICESAKSNFAKRQKDAMRQHSNRSLRSSENSLKTSMSTDGGAVAGSPSGGGEVKPHRDHMLRSSSAASVVGTPKSGKSCIVM
jgi:atypical dual specificity phosphatase